MFHEASRTLSGKKSRASLVGKWWRGRGQGRVHSGVSFPWHLSQGLLEPMGSYPWPQLGLGPGPQGTAWAAFESCHGLPGSKRRHPKPSGRPQSWLAPPAAGRARQGLLGWGRHVLSHGVFPRPRPARLAPGSRYFSEIRWDRGERSFFFFGFDFLRKLCCSFLSVATGRPLQS